MAGRPLDAMALLGLGLRTLSMQPGQIGPIKMMIRSLNLGEVAGLCGPAVRPDRPFPADPAVRLRRGTGHCPEIAGFQPIPALNRFFAVQRLFRRALFG